MKRIAFRMKLFKGFEHEYKKRHDEIWEDLVQLLRDSGVEDFSIFLDEQSGDLFAFINAEDDNQLSEIGTNPLQQKWWTYMKDIMETNDDHSPKKIDLVEVFTLQNKS